MTLTFSWPPAAAPPPLETDQIHVWSVHLRPPAPQLKRLAELLSTDESERAARFHFDHDREAFIAAHGSLREILSDYLRRDPRSLHFETTETGKPFLPTESLHFNLAHSGAAALIAVSHHAGLGIDIEKLRPLDDMLTIARRFFAPEEYQALLALTSTQQTLAFFNGWTRKEAFVKANGQGLQFALNRFAVSLTPAAPARLLHIDGDKTAAARWQLWTLQPAAAYVGALAIEQPPPLNLLCRHWAGASTTPR